MTRLFHGDCIKVMDQLIDEGVKVDLTVTSPPYDNLRTYKNSLEWNQEIWQAVINKLYHITQDGGVVVWVVGDATIKGSETGTSFKQALYFKEVGFNLHDTMIYQKTGISKPGTFNRYHPNFEYMFIFSKGKPKTYNLIKDRKNITAGSKLKSTDRKKNGQLIKCHGFNKITKQYGKRFNIWKIPHAKRGLNTKHPASFPDKLAHDHIISWSNEQDLILDPFLGSGTTGAAAKELNRRFIGIEKVKEYYDIAKQQIDEVPEYEAESLFSGAL